MKEKKPRLGLKFRILQLEHNTFLTRKRAKQIQE
jgi:hypothetical protein